MQFTIFTLIITVLWVGIFIKLISLLRKQMAVLRYFSIYPLFILLMFCILRIIFPVELPFTRIINSRKILPLIQKFFYTPFIHYGYIKINLAFIIGTVWIVGTILIIFKRIRDYYRFKHLLNFLPASEDKHLYDIFSKANVNNRLNNVKIIVHSSVPSPAIIGCIHPVIILPDISFDDDELLGIFIHESTHYKYKHHLIKLVTESICICFWWNPLFQQLSSEIAHALEMHSDKIVSYRLNQKQQKKYLAGITKVIRNINNRKSISAFSCSLVEGKNEEKLQQRFRMMLENNYQNKKKYNVIVIPFVLSIFLLSYAFVLQPYSEPTLTDYGEMDTSNSNFYFIETEDGYDLYNSANQFIIHMDNIDEGLKGAKIYENTKEVEKK